MKYTTPWTILMCILAALILVYPAHAVDDQKTDGGSEKAGIASAENQVKKDGADKLGSDGGGKSKASGDLDRGRELISKQRYQEAAQVLTRVVKQQPDNGEAWFNLGWCHHGLGNMDEAIQNYRSAATFPSFKPTALYNLASAYGSMGAVNHALAAFEQARKAGFNNMDLVNSDPSMAAVRSHTRFVAPRTVKFHEIELDGEQKLYFGVLLPHGYEEDESYPVLLALPPGASDSSVRFGFNSYWGEQAAARGWVVVSPYTPDGGWHSDNGHAAMARLLASIREHVKIEGDKIHLAGAGSGSQGAFEFAFEKPEQFHTLTCISGHADPEVDDARLEKLADMRVNILMGERNEEGMDLGRAIVQRLMERGITPNFQVFGDAEEEIAALMAENFIQYMEDQRRSILR